MAGKYHIARMQILLDDLGSADSMYRQMYDSSVDSAGSAMDENEKFMESLQARINLARVEVEKLALAMGDAFLTESMITGLQLFGDFLGAVTKFVDKFGVLPALMGTTGVALFLLSTRFKTLAGSVGSSIVSLIGFRGAATASASASALTSSAVRGLGIAFKGLLASTGVGLVLVGVGVAIESLLGSMGKQREIQEEINKENKNLTESYSANRNEINSLSSEYTKLEESMKGSSPDTETQQRYYDVQNKLAELMPNLVKYEDSYGNKILDSGTVIESKIKLLEKQIQTEEALQQIQNAESDADKQDQSEKDLKSSRALAERMQEEFASKAGSFLTGFSYEEDINNLQDMETALAHFVAKKKELLDEGATVKTPAVLEVSDTIDDLQRLMDRYNSYSSDMESAQSYLTNKYAENAEKMILKNTDIEDSTKDLANSMLYDFTAMAKSSQEAKSISDVFGDGDFQKSLEDASKQIGIFTSSTSDNFENQKKSFLEYAEVMKSSILSDMKGSNGAPLAEDSKAYQNAEQSIDSYVDKLILREQAIRDVMSTEGQSREEALLNIQALGDMENGQESLTDTLSEYVGKLYEKASAEEQVAGVTENLINEVDNLVFLYNSLSSQTSLTAEQSLALRDAQDKLLAIYPQLNKNGEFRIESIVAERNAQDVLLRAVKASKEGQLTLEEQTTLGHLSETNARIAIINSEISASQKLANAYASVYDSVVSAAEGGSESAAKLLMRISVPTVKAQMAQAELATLEKARGGYVNTLSSALDNLDSSTGKSTDSTNGNTKATKDSTKATKESIYITDKYKQALEAVNAEIAKQQSLRSTMTDYSKEYRDSLQKEIKLEKEKSKLMQAQAASIEKQIKSGKIAQTGTISQSSSSTSTKNLSGWGGSVTSNYGTRSDPFTGKKTMHAGVDLAGKKGTRLDANVSGKVVQAGNKGNGFGNYVTIQAEDGMKHIYAHLDKVVATLGQTITAGMQVGTIGSTGRSTGSHLHYEVRNGNNASINPNDYMQEAKSGKVTTTNTTPSGISNAQQSIDQAKSDLLSLQQDISNSEAAVSQLQSDLINSQLSSFEKRHNDLQHNIDDEIQKREKLDSVSQAYHDSIKNQISRTNIQLKNYENEKAYLTALINSTQTTSKVKAELTDKVKDLSLAIVDLNINTKELTFERIQATMRRFAEEIDDTNYAIERSNAIMGTLEEGSPGYTAELKKQVDMYEKLKDQNIAYRESLQRSLLLHDLLPERVKEITEELEDLGLAIWDIEGAIIDTNESIKNSNEKLATEVADKMIDAHKEYLEQKQDMSDKAYEKESDAEDDRHDKVMKNYSDEKEAFQEIIQDKLDALDKEESARDYNKDIDKLEADKTKLSNEINLLSMDDSLEAKAQRKKLQEELAKIDEEIAEKRHDREVDLRKENLNELLTEKEEEMAKLEELENTRHDSEKLRIEDLKEYWNQFYQDQLDDEAYFAQMKKDIVAGNFKDLSAEFQGYLNEMKASMPDVENTLDGTMKAVGTSIRQNVINTIQEAIDAFAKLEKSTGGTSGGGSTGIGTGVSTSLGKGDLEVLGAKFLTDRLATQETGARATNIRDKAHNLASQGRSQGSTLSSNVGFDSLITQYSDSDKKTIAEYFKSSLSDTLMSDYLKEIIKKYSDNLMKSSVGLATGGYTKSDGLTMLHKDEVVLNKKETKDFFKFAPVLEKLNRMISPLMLPNISQPSLAGNTNNNSPIKIEFVVENMNATKDEAMNCVNDIMVGLKRERGY